MLLRHNANINLPRVIEMIYSGTIKYIMVVLCRVFKLNNLYFYLIPENLFIFLGLKNTSDVYYYLPNE